ncbi:DUF6920 family protein [Chamaesiphon minutus]|uniref:Uncharacterized protein n=1 Tax=Chamaesiphon minutus (strain ATCC 27169 / PCC 6605) TaxID=1173020 RepID=K9UB97_CHAP6|nr:DUF6544 family protein [Chamaesiphon minutus]AFY92362.1 hypothetical protein Cha6605_1139 [Chamaesiphon minutus PCC 6605]
MWIKSIVIITVSVIVLFGIASLYGKYQWQLETDRLRDRLTNGKQTINPKTYDAKELEGLPDPVQRFFRVVLKEGQPIVAAVNLSQQGIFNMSETEAKWSPFTATQFVTTQRSGFDWDARIQMAPGVSAFVHDAYALGAGSLHASLLGLFTVADVRDTPAAAQGELLRFFAEMPWYPTALLPSQGVRWEAIDDTSARATLTDAPTTVSLVFRFNAEGTIETMRAEARCRDKLTAMPWSGRFWNYSVCNEMLIPLEGEVGWEYPDGIRLYYKGKVTEINYEFAP